MLNPDRKRTCFVVMPFGEEKDLDGQDIDFDEIYRFFLEKVIKSLGIKCIRSDQIEEAGSIHDKMIEHIVKADVVVVDVTTSNANLYYLLGVRHALVRGVTVLIRRKGTTIPFNIQNLNVVEYDQTKFENLERAKARIRRIIESGLDFRRNDSPVHAILSAPGNSPVEMGERPEGLAGAIEWYREGRISQGQAAEFAGLGRAEFLEELARAKVSAYQATVDELMEEVDRAVEAHRQRVAIDPAVEGRAT